MKSRADIPITLDTVLHFGKHKGWTIGECVEADPSYVIWLSEDGVMKIPVDILEQAEMNEYDKDDDYYFGENYYDDYYDEPF